MKLWQAMRALSEGKEIEYQLRENKMWWPLAKGSVFTADEEKYDFRLKPEKPKPLECWAVVYPGGNANLYSSEDEAKRCAGKHCVRTIHLKEVPEAKE